MPRVVFTANLQRHVEAPAMDAAGSTVAEVLDAAFAANPRVRGYVVDEHGRLREHVVVFVGGAPVRDRVRLADPVPDGAEVFVMQALSGG